MLKIYAIIHKETDIVVNIVNVEQEQFIFYNQETEYYALANRAVEIGMTYDKKTGKFPEAGDKGELIDLRDEISSLVISHQQKMSENSHMTIDQLVIHTNYISSLQTILSANSYIDMKSQFDARQTEPEFPPAPRVINQDDFRSTLKLTEKMLWDNPETGTPQQAAAINTIKMDFPYYEVASMVEELALLQEVEFLTADRVKEIKLELASPHEIESLTADGIEEVTSEPTSPQQVESSNVDGVEEVTTEIS
jgi:hypothetical protein